MPTRRNILRLCALLQLAACSLGANQGHGQRPPTAGSSGDATHTDESTSDSETGEEDDTGSDGNDGSTADGGSGSSEDDGSDESDGTGSSDSTGDVGPKVVGTTPAEGTEGVARQASISIAFDQPIEGSSISTNGGSSECLGSVQVSDDSFTTCVPLADQAVADDPMRFALTPTEPLKSLGHYYILVTTAVRSTDDVELESNFTSSEPFIVRYGHTITIDGANDFNAADEALASSSPGITGYVAWDESHVYLGLDAQDVASSNPYLFWFAYLGGNPGTTTGIGYQGQTPTLPFEAQWHPRWKSDNSYTNMQQYGESWGNATATWLEGGDIAQSGTFVEMRLPRTSLGDPQTLPMSMGLLREQPDDQATYGVVPGEGTTDGFDPDIGAYLELQLDGSVRPSDHPIL